MNFLKGNLAQYLSPSLRKNRSAKLMCEHCCIVEWFHVHHCGMNLKFEFSLGFWDKKMSSSQCFRQCWR